MSPKTNTDLFFEPLEKAIAEKNPNIDCINLPLGANLFGQIHSPHEDPVYYLRSGQVRMYRLENATTNIIKAKALLGDISAFCHLPPSATLLTMQPCEVAVMNSEWFLSQLLLAVPSNKKPSYYLKSYIQKILLRMLESEKTAGAEIENLKTHISNGEQNSTAQNVASNNYSANRQRLYQNFCQLMSQMTEEQLQFRLVDFSHFLLKDVPVDFRQGYEWIKMFLNDLHTLNAQKKIFNPGNKTPFRNVSRIHMTSEYKMEMEIDIHSQLYPVTLETRLYIKTIVSENTRNAYTK